MYTIAGQLLTPSQSIPFPAIISEVHLKEAVSYLASRFENELKMYEFQNQKVAHSWL
jgi:hypothetical protein